MFAKPEHLTERNICRYISLKTVNPLLAVIAVGRNKRTISVARTHISISFIMHMLTRLYCMPMMVCGRIVAVLSSIHISMVLT
jgi:hypothetical protein